MAILAIICSGILLPWLVMKKGHTMSTLAMLASSIAGIVGSGWLLGPMVAARLVGPAATITWIIGGLLMMVVAAPFVILSRDTPTTGGTVRFFQLTHGHFAGFSISWIAWLAWAAVSPIETMALVQYSANYIPGLMTHSSTPVLTLTGILVAMGLMTLISVINSFGVTVYNKINYAILAFKLCIPLGTALLLLHVHYQPSNFIAAGGFMPFGLKSIAMALPIAGVIYSFIGFNPAIQMAAETSDPKRAIPIAIFGSLLACMLLYTLLQVAFIAALPASSLSHGWSHLHYAGATGPFAGLLGLFGLGIFVKALYADAIVSPFGTAMVQSMATSRLSVGMARNGYFPKSLMRQNKRGSPVNAIILNTLVGYCFFLPFPSWQHMVGFLVSCLSLGYIVGPMSLMTRPTTTARQHFLCYTAFFICTLIMFWSGWAVIWKLALVFSLGSVIVLFKKHEKLNLYRGSWMLFYMAGLTILSYLSSFGGIHVMPFGIDFIVIALATAAIYSMAFYLTRTTELESG